MAGNEYVGSLMSLVTHNGVKYEGTMSLVDMASSSITLSAVRCLGGAGVPGNPNQIFDSVVFKGSDIVELTVLAPPPPPPPPPPQHAAVAVQPHPAHHTIPATAADRGSVGHQQQDVGGFPPPGGTGAPAGAPAWTAAPEVAPTAWGAPTAAQTETRAANVAPAPAPTVTVASIPKPGAPQENGAPAGRPRPASYANAAGAPPPTATGGRGRGSAAARGGGRASGAGRGRGGRGHGQGGRGGRGGARAGGRGLGAAPPAEVSIPKEEFNFEEALKRFNKDELSKEVAQTGENENAQATEKSVYSKDDFFDEISCEALERLANRESGGSTDRRGRAAAQRRTDVETFGGAAARHGRARGRGHRGRRGGREGRGRHHRQADGSERGPNSEKQAGKKAQVEA